MHLYRKRFILKTRFQGPWRMKKLTSLIAFIAISLLSSTIVDCRATPVVKSFAGFWIYGFEQSYLETCGGQLYWMWTPTEFNGKYTAEGHRNPVKLSGYLSPPSPDENMYSPLVELTWLI